MPSPRLVCRLVASTALCAMVEGVAHGEGRTTATSDGGRPVSSRPGSGDIRPSTRIVPAAVSAPLALTAASPPAPADEAGRGPLHDFAPTGAAGPLTVLPYPDVDPSGGFLPVGDRWRIGFPEYDRLGRRNPLDRYTMGAVSGNYQYVRGLLYDPYNQNILKGDYPIIGQHTFVNVTLTSETTYEYRRLPTPSGESTDSPDKRDFFGDPNQNFFAQNFVAQIDVFHGSTAFKPFDWKFRVTPVLNYNYLDLDEQGVTDVDVRQGTYRSRRDFAVQELFLEHKLADVSSQYDFVSVRGGRQAFVSDFRGFVFNDVTQGVRLFGNSEANRNQWNVAYFFQPEKETNSELNEWDARHQHVVVANIFRQDSLDFEFLPPEWRKGYTQEASFTFQYDDQNTRGLHIDKNGFLVRPDAVGEFTPHDLYAGYFGWTGDGHIGRMNLNHALYWLVGRDYLNPLAGERGTINAQMAEVEPSIDFDWFRARTAFLWASGDRSPQDKVFRGFDSILDNTNFIGGPFSFWNRQSLKLLTVNLVQRNSVYPDLSSSKIQGQSNYVNPGIYIANAGFDADVTPTLKAIFNTSYLWFAYTDSLELFLKQDKINREIGLDMSIGFEYRPLLNNNVIFTVGVGTLFPGDGFKKLYETDKNLYSVFTSLTLTF